MRKEFSANVSHELKTPLTSISGFAELMENHLVAPEDVPEFAAKIHRESERLLTLVNDIIKVSQLDDKEVYYGKENIDLLSFAKEVCDRLEPMAQSRNVTVELSGDAVLYLASRQLMNDLFYNLIENGIKYNKPNGKLWVTVSEKKGHPCISVKDTGFLNGFFVWIKVIQNRRAEQVLDCPLSNMWWNIMAVTLKSTAKWKKEQKSLYICK